MGLFLALVLWTLCQIWWLRVDGRLVPGDEMGSLGALEEFRWLLRDGQYREFLAEAFMGRRGEYPNLYAALSALASRVAQIEDLDGDGPQLLGLAWAWIGLAATWFLGRVVAPGRPLVALFGCLLLLLSPQWSGLQRHVMIENGVAAVLPLVVALAFLAIPRERAGGLGLVLGLSAGLAMLFKQTAVLVLLPLALAAFPAGWLRPASRPLPWRRLVLAGLVAGLVCGPWYLRNASDQLPYLSRTLAANPGSAGAIRQLFFYPLALAQQSWAPVVWVAAVLLALRARVWSVPRPLVLIVLVHILVLLFIPKKYPRLLVTLQPFLCLAVASLAVRWPTRSRWVLLFVAGVSWGACQFSSSPLLAPLRDSRMGLTDIDDKCFQVWTEAPSGPELPWAALVALVEEHGGRSDEFGIGSPAWPMPSCEHRATFPLGEHLAVRLRRQGFEARVLLEGWSSEQGWSDQGSTAEPPSVLVAEAGFSCRQHPGLCDGRGAPRLLGLVRSANPDWPLELEVYGW